MMYIEKEGMVYKLHTGWFINRTPGEFINRDLFVKFKGLLCGNPAERGDAEATIKIKHFRKRAHPHGKPMFGQR